MLRQFCVGFVEPDLVLAVFVHAGFEIVTLEDSCDTTVIAESSHMGCGPTFLIHGKERFYISITAVEGREDTKTYAGMASPVSLSMTEAVSPAQSTCMISPGL